MKDIFIFEGKNYISARRASEISEYSSDYIGQLCRADKLDCRMVGRAWFVTLDSIEAHKKHVIEVETDPSRVENIRPRKVTSFTSVPILASDPIVDASVKFVPTTDLNISTVPSFGLIYGSEDAPLLPVLNKVQPVALAPSTYVSSKNLGQTTLSATPVRVSHSFRSRLAVSAVLVVLLVGGLIGYSTFIVTPGSLQTDQVASVSGIVTSFISFFDRSVDSVLAFFGYPRDTRNDLIAQNNTAPQLFNGMAIIPSDTSATDAQTKQRVRESFSDQVEVHPDQSGTAGVVKPIFKESKGDDFVYVLVPVKENKSP